MRHEAHDSELFSSKLVARALDAGFTSPLDYYYYLRYDDPAGREFDALIDSLVVGETYFFREMGAIRVLCDEMLAPAIAAGKRPRIWCAASATGEEPLTLAIALAQEDRLGRVEIVASDISPRALARAKEATYGPRSFRATSDEDKARWFDRVGDTFVARRELRDAITWRRVNLTDAGAVSALGTFDAIVCRNVLIYFGESTVRNVVTTLASVLSVGGPLLVGASESLLRFGTLLNCEEHGGAFFYRKTAP